MRIQDLTKDGAVSRVLGYNGSLNGAVGDVVTLSGTPDNTWGRFGCDYNAGVAAMVYFDGTDWSVKVGTLSGTVITWGSAVVLSGTATVANLVPNVCVLSSSLLLVGYKDNEGTPQYEVKSFSISGTSLTLDQTLNVAQTAGASTEGIFFAKVSASRVVAMYRNASGYPTVIGVNASFGSLTKDGTAAVLISSSPTEETLCINSIGSGKLHVSCAISSALYAAVVTDSGSSTSSTTMVQKTGSTTGIPVSAAGSDGGVAFGSGTVSGTMYPFRVSAGSIAAEFTDTNQVDSVKPAAFPHSTGAAGADLRGAWLANPEGTNYSFALFPCCPGNQAGKIYGLFIGFETSSGSPEQTLTQHVRLITASATNRRARNARIVGVDSTTFILFYINDTDADYKYLVGKL